MTFKAHGTHSHTSGHSVWKTRPQRRQMELYINTPGATYSLTKKTWSGASQYLGPCDKTYCGEYKSQRRKSKPWLAAHQMNIHIFCSPSCRAGAIRNLWKLRPWGLKKEEPDSSSYCSAPKCVSPKHMFCPLLLLRWSPTTSFKLLLSIKVLLKKWEQIFHKSSENFSIINYDAPILDTLLLIKFKRQHILGK